MRFLNRLLVIYCLLISSIVFATDNFVNTKLNKVPGELLVKSNSSFMASEHVQEKFHGLSVKVTSVTKNIFKLKTTPESAEKILKNYKKSADIEYIQPNFIYRAFNNTPAIQNFVNDPKLSEQWGIQNVKVQKAWDITKGSSDLVVAVIDTGVDYNHEDLKANIWMNAGEIAGNGVDDDNNGFIDDVRGWDFATDKNDPMDIMSSPRFSGNPGHGTHCAGVVGAVSDNGKGISGVAPGIKLMALRFLTENGQGTTEGAIKALRYAIDNGAKVINNSWGGESDPNEDDKALKDIISYGESKDVLMIFAAGNGRNGIGYNNDTDSRPVSPASYTHENIISVAAIDVNDAIGNFSNFGVKSVDIGAPGVKIMSTVPKNQYEDQIMIFGFPLAPWNGTSMAAPHVTGVAALIRSIRPELTYSEVKDIILGSARSISGLSGKVGTGGTLDAEKALELAISSN